MINLLFFLLYNHLAFTYEWVAWVVSLGQWHHWRQTALPHLREGRTLELAFGTGVLFTQMMQEGISAVGVDISPFMARITARRLRRAGFPPDITRARAEKLPFPAEHFANAIATFPTEYIFRPETLAEVWRVLSPGGRLIIVLQGDLRRFGWVNTVIEWLYRVTGQRETVFSALEPRFHRAGFAVEQTITTVENATARLLIAEKIPRSD